MSQIFLYAGQMFTGTQEAYANDLPNYQSGTNVKVVESIKVTSGTWVVFSEANYKGTIAVYKAGGYGHTLKIDKIGSFRKFSGELENHDITVFDLSNYQGSQKILKDKEYQVVTNLIMSHRVLKGVWILYDAAGLKGSSIVSIKGDEVPDETTAGLSGPVKSLMAYLTYEPETQ